MTSNNQRTTIEHRVKTHDGLHLAVQERLPISNSAPVLLCIPGLTRNRRDFEPLCEALPLDCHIFIVELRGRGHSDFDPDPNNYHPGVYVQDILTVLQHFDLHKVILVGTSLGGIVSTVLASIDSSRIAGIILNDIGPAIMTEGLRKIREYVGVVKPVRDWQEAIKLARSVHQMHYPDFTDDEWLAFVKRLYKVTADGSLLADYDPAIGLLNRQVDVDNPPDLWPQFNAIKTLPILLIHGQLSNILSQKTVDQMLLIKPDLQVCQLSNRGHAPLLDEPDSINAVTTFIEGLEL